MKISGILEGARRAPFLVVRETYMQEILKGRKLNMSQMFTEGGKVIPVTYVLLDEAADNKIDDEVIGKNVKVWGLSKGKGFAGGMKRYGFKGGPATRGQSTYPRQAGSIGSQTPGRVRKGKKMAGHYGNKRITVKGLKIVDFKRDERKVTLSGPVPGARNSKVNIRLI
jgi:ribosomal protein L3